MLVEEELKLFERAYKRAEAAGFSEYIEPLSAIIENLKVIRELDQGHN